MSRMFGVAPLYQFIERNKKQLSTDLRKIIKESFVFVYEVVGKGCIFFIEYLEKSPDEPLGSITNIFPRFEFQTSKGNAPHLHIIIWTVEKRGDPVVLEKSLRINATTFA